MGHLATRPCKLVHTDELQMITLARKGKSPKFPEIRQDDINI